MDMNGVFQIKTNPRKQELISSLETLGHISHQGQTVAKLKESQVILDVNHIIAVLTLTHCVLHLEQLAHFIALNYF